MKKLLALVVFCLFVAVPSFSFSEPIKVEDLWSEFDSNELAFEARYKGKRINLVGEIQSVGRTSITKEPQVTLKAGLISTVTCRFPEKYASTLAKLEPGTTTTMSGVYSSKSIRTLFFENCGGRL